MWQRAESATHATFSGSTLIIHSDRCTKERFTEVTKDEALLRMERLAGFTTMVYTNDRDLTFTLELPSITPSDTDRAQYAKNFEASMSATHPELKLRVTSDGKRLIIHTPYASKADYYKADWTKAKQMWLALGFTEFLYTNDEKLSLLMPIAPVEEPQKSSAKEAVAPEIAKVVEPFGFRKGMSKKDVVTLIGAANVKEDKDDHLVLATAPRPNPVFEEYLLVISPAEGVLKVVGLGKTVETGDSGMELRSTFNGVLDGVTQKYGKPNKIYDFCNGTGCDDHAYWMLSLREKNRVLAGFWDLDYAAIIVEAKAVTMNSGYVTYGLEFPGFAAYSEAKAAKQNDSY